MALALSDDLKSACWCKARDCPTSQLLDSGQRLEAHCLRAQIGRWSYRVRSLAVKLTQQIPDNLTDEVCLCQIKMRSVPTWTAQKFERFAKFKQLARRKRYILYTADVGDHQLYGGSNSCRLDVPTNQKGALKRFGGNRIRLVCEVESQIGTVPL